MVEILRTTKQGDKVHCGTQQQQKERREGLVCKQGCGDYRLNRGKEREGPGLQG